MVGLDREVGAQKIKHKQTEDLMMKRDGDASRHPQEDDAIRVNGGFEEVYKYKGLLILKLNNSAARVDRIENRWKCLQFESVKSAQEFQKLVTNLAPTVAVCANRLFVSRKKAVNCHFQAIVEPHHNSS
ncbi:hypothetical protein AVEN_185952-1 [Araneus ventricosus]|uniref:Uncharacterized protein n=1 Tax=Araneus ventricosus TaxID=182803 RepID=A0A4Y2W1K9_ARAVE|nr:hypothetical protein AVEN_185952-1 [Araneus ventricosus]